MVPREPIAFIQDCVRRGRILWSYHVNMRLAGRFIRRASVLEALGSPEVVEAYPDDKYLPSYLVLGSADDESFHVLVAVDVEGDNIRIVTAYRPDAGEWQSDLKTRRRRQ